MYTSNGAKGRRFLKTSRHCSIFASKQTHLDFATVIISLPPPRRDVRQTKFHRSGSRLAENERVLSCVNDIGTIFLHCWGHIGVFQSTFHRFSYLELFGTRDFVHVHGRTFTYMNILLNTSLNNPSAIRKIKSNK